MQDQWIQAERIPTREEALAAKILFLANDADNPEKQKETLALNFSGSNKPVDLKKEQKAVTDALDKWIEHIESWDSGSKADANEKKFWSSLQNQVKNLHFEKAQDKSFEEPASKTQEAMQAPLAPSKSEGFSR